MHKTLHQQVIGSESDLKAEYVAADLIEYQNQEIDNINIIPIGGFNRPVRNDIEDISEADNQFTREIDILVNRDGLYDALPQAMIHLRPPSNDYRISIDSMLSDMRKNREEEEYARKFFRIFEEELNRIRILIEIEERQSLLGFNDTTKHDIFLNIWDNIVQAPKELLNKTFYFLKYISIFSGNHEFFLYVVRKILSVEIVIEKIPKTIPLYQFSSLANTYLGYNSILITQHPSYLSDIVIKVKELQRNQLKLFLPGGLYQKLLSSLADYFLPVEQNVRIDLEMTNSEDGLTLDSGDYVSHLSITSTLYSS